MHLSTIIIGDEVKSRPRFTNCQTFNTRLPDIKSLFSSPDRFREVAHMRLSADSGWMTGNPEVDRHEGSRWITSALPCRFKRSMQHPLVSWSYNNFPRETDLFCSTRLTPSQDCVLGDSDLVGAFSSCFQCNAGSSRVLR
jgi:hypothetical protein